MGPNLCERGQQRPNSTHVLVAVRAPDRIAVAAEAQRRDRDCPAVAHLTWRGTR